MISRLNGGHAAGNDGPALPHDGGQQDAVAQGQLHQRRVQYAVAVVAGSEFQSLHLAAQQLVQ